VVRVPGGFEQLGAVDPGGAVVVAAVDQVMKALSTVSRSTGFTWFTSTSAGSNRPAITGVGAVSEPVVKRLDRLWGKPVGLFAEHQVSERVNRPDQR
jgi:hypothetical protein